MPSTAGEVVELAGSGSDAAQGVAGSGLDGTTKIILLIVVIFLVIVGIVAIIAKKHQAQPDKSKDVEAGCSDGDSLLSSKVVPYEPKQRHKLVLPAGDSGASSITEFATNNPIVPPPSPYFRDERTGEPPKQAGPGSEAAKAVENTRHSSHGR